MHQPEPLLLLLLGQMTNRTTRIHRRNDGIDTLRGWSILSVLFLHCWVHLPKAQELLQGVGKATTVIFRSGYYGVHLFFVISGFLITTISLQRWGRLDKISLPQFYRMRAARILPCLLGLLAVLSVMHLLSLPGYTLPRTSLIQTIGAALTFTLNFLEAETGYFPACWDVLWSLSVEEMFYLFFPLLGRIACRQRNFIAILLLFVALGPFARTVFSDNELWKDHSYLSCMDGIALGCLAALVAQHIRLDKQKFRLMLALGIGLCTFIGFFRKQAFALGLAEAGLNETVLALGSGLLLIASQEWYVKERHQGSKVFAPIRWFGRHSYEIYLTHGFVVLSIAKILPSEEQTLMRVLTGTTIIAILSGIVGQFVAVYFSEPLNRRFRSSVPEHNSAKNKELGKYRQ